ncbi:CHASE domain-containing protein, partial [Vibrio parahaemolyticus]|nr:CHASE domain-containing protein [Vibrio parahaemolyticus]
VQEIFIAGPVTLIQGGRGLIVRVPVFLDPPMNQDYWGVISAVIDFDALMRETGVIDFSYRYPLMIRGYDSGGSFGDAFFGAQSVNSMVYAKVMVLFPYGGWSMVVFSGGKADRQISWHQLHLARVIGYPIIFALSLALFAIYRLYTIADDRALHDELTNLPNRRYFMK